MSVWGHVANIDLDNAFKTIDREYLNIIHLIDVDIAQILNNIDLTNDHKKTFQEHFNKIKDVYHSFLIISKNIDSYFNEFNQMKNDIKKIKNDKIDSEILNQTKESLISRINYLIKTTHDLTENKYNSFDKRVVDLEIERIQLKCTLDDLQRENNNLKKKIDELQKKIEDLQKENDDLKKKVEEHDKKFEEQTKNFNARFEEQERRFNLMYQTQKYHNGLMLFYQIFSCVKSKICDKYKYDKNNTSPYKLILNLCQTDATLEQDLIKIYQDCLNLKSQTLDNVLDYIRIIFNERKYHAHPTNISVDDITINIQNFKIDYGDNEKLSVVADIFERLIKV